MFDAGICCFRDFPASAEGDILAGCFLHIDHPSVQSDTGMQSGFGYSRGAAYCRILLQTKNIGFDGQRIWLPRSGRNCFGHSRNSRYS